MKHLDRSPINNNSLKPFISAKDYTVSNESFDILADIHSGLLITSPRPNDEDLGAYYESKNYISHTNSSLSIFDKIYQIVRNYTIGRKIKLVNSVVGSEKNILDIGAGTGEFLNACKKNGWHIEGIEPNLKARNEALKNFGLQFKKERSDLGANRFDVITMWHVLEHVPDLNKQVEALKQLLKPNGTLIVAVPNYKSYDARYYKEFWAAYDVPRHLWHFSQNAIKALFEVGEMKIVKTAPMKFDAYYVSLLSEKYKNGKMSFIKGLYRGFLSNAKAFRSKEYSSLIYLIKNA